MSVSHRFSSTHTFKIAFFFVLVLLVNLSYVLSFLILFGVNFIDMPQDNFRAYINLIPIISISALLLADFLQFARFFRKTSWDILSQSFKFVFIQTLVSTTAKDLLEQRALPRSVLLFSAVLMFAMLTLSSALCMKISKRLYKQNSLVIIGSSLAHANAMRDKILPYLEQYDLKLTHSLIYTDRLGIRAAIREQSEVFISPDVPDEMKSEIILQCAKTNTVAYLVPQFYEIALYQSRLLNINDLMVFMLDRMGLTFEQRLLKRTFDIIVSVLALIISSPILLVSAIAVKLSDGGDVFFRQKRYTIDKKPYYIIKLRTMHDNAEKATGPVISGKNDPRVTAVGKILRRTKIDELPQFINVLMGDMSVVGPRAERPELISNFEKTTPDYVERFSVKAGITGLAQVMGNYDSTAQDKLRYDLLYIKNYSLYEDIKIILHTVRAIVTPNLYNRTFQENQEVYAPATREEIREGRKLRKEVEAQNKSRKHHPDE